MKKALNAFASHAHSSARTKQGMETTSDKTLPPNQWSPTYSLEAMKTRTSITIHELVGPRWNAVGTLGSFKVSADHLGKLQVSLKDLKQSAKHFTVVAFGDPREALEHIRKSPPSLVLTDAMMQLEASNEYIAAIFDCYKSLVKHFRKYGFMKKVYETAREFEAAVRTAFNMVPTDQLDDFLSIFEEARYSEHTIDATHRDRAMQTLGAITNSLTMSLGEESVVKRIDTSSIYDNLTKAGEFVAADGSVRQAGIVEGENTDFKI